MEFKGTKGKWNLKERNSERITICDDRIDVWGFVNKDEMKANATLVSKAPELLDFINRISGEMLRNDFVLSEKWYEQAQELIKQATEI